MCHTAAAGTPRATSPPGGKIAPHLSAGTTARVRLASAGPVAPVVRNSALRPFVTGPGGCCCGRVAGSLHVHARRARARAPCVVVDVETYCVSIVSPLHGTSGEAVRPSPEVYHPLRLS